MKNYNGTKLIQQLVILGDFVLLNSLLWLVGRKLDSIVPPFFADNPRIVFLIANMSLVVAEYFFHTVLHKRHIQFDRIVQRVAQLVILQSFTAFVLIRMVSNGGGFFRFLLFYAPLFFFTLVLVRALERFTLNRFREMGRNRRYVLLIGSDPANLIVYNELVGDPSTGYLVKGYYSNDTIENCPKELVRLGSKDDFIRMMELDEVDAPKTDDLFCCLSHDESDLIVKIMRYCDKNIIHFFYVPRMYGNFSLNLKPEQVGNQILFTNYQEPLSMAGNRALKRTFDITVSGLVCLAMLPVIPVIAILIKRQSPGPIFFKQARTGINGKTFWCYKFRSMHVNSDADNVQATADDPRKFAFGNFMRKTNIDEFPQFFNVLKGDMSIVGPRPHMLHHTEVYSNLIERYMVRHYSKPGITGWAQVTGFRGETKELWQMEERIRRDIWYIENWSFWLDIRIIFLTAKSIIKPDEKAY